MLAITTHLEKDEHIGVFMANFQMKRLIYGGFRG